MNKAKHFKNATWWGAFIAFGITVIASYASYNYILPTDVRNSLWSQVTVGDMLRVIVALIISMACAWMGYVIGDTMTNSD